MLILNVNALLLGVCTGIVLPEYLLECYVLGSRVDDIVTAMDQNLIHF